MPTKLADIMAELPQDRQDKIRKMSEELIKHLSKINKTQTLWKLSSST